VTTTTELLDFLCALAEEKGAAAVRLAVAEAKREAAGPGDAARAQRAVRAARRALEQSCTNFDRQRARMLAAEVS
jgi:hypothetical protein